MQYFKTTSSPTAEDADARNLDSPKQCHRGNRSTMQSSANKSRISLKRMTGYSNKELDTNRSIPKSPRSRNLRLSNSLP